MTIRKGKEVVKTQKSKATGTSTHRITLKARAARRPTTS